jgi:protein-L-isoaspartate(D-aspartate) O-methyltransferase
MQKIGKDILCHREDLPHYREARERMVEEQLEKRGIKDKRVLDVMRKVPRHLFVEQSLRARSYGDYPLPIGYGQTISQPYMVALMTECLSLKGGERTLEIGTGSGYQAAVLSLLCEKVYTVERIKELAQRAQKLLQCLCYKNVVVFVRDGSLGLVEFSPFDRIIVTCACPDIPKPLTEQLADGGILVLPKGDKLTQTLCIVKKKRKGLSISSAGGCVFVPLIGKYGWEEE